MQKSPYIVPGTMVIEKNITAKKTFKAIEIVTGITPEQMKVKCRKRYIVEARHIFNKIMHENTKLTLSAIGSYVNRDHATVLHSKKTLENLMPYQKELREKYEEIYETAINFNELNHSTVSSVTVGTYFI